MNKAFEQNKGIFSVFIGVLLSICFFFIVKNYGILLDKDSSNFKTFLFLLELIFIISPIIVGIDKLIDNAILQKELRIISIDTIIYDISSFIKNCIVIFFKFISSVYNWFIENKTNIHKIIYFGTFFYIIVYFYLSSRSLIDVFMFFSIAFFSLFFYTEVKEKENIIPSFFKNCVIYFTVMLSVISFFTSDIGSSPKSYINSFNNKYGSEKSFAAQNYLYNFPNEKLKIYQFFLFKTLEVIPNSAYSLFYENNMNHVGPITITNDPTNGTFK